MHIMDELWDIYLSDWMRETCSSIPRLPHSFHNLIEECSTFHWCILYPHIIPHDKDFMKLGDFVIIHVYVTYSRSRLPFLLSYCEENLRIMTVAPIMLPHATLRDSLVAGYHVWIHHTTFLKILILIWICVVKKKLSYHIRSTIIRLSDNVAELGVKHWSTGSHLPLHQKLQQENNTHWKQFLKNF